MYGWGQSKKNKGGRSLLYLKRTSPDTNLWGPVTMHVPTMQPPKYIDLDRRAKKARLGYVVRLNGIKTTFYKSRNVKGKLMTFFIPADNRLSLIKGWYYVKMSGNSENLNETIDSNMEFT